VARHAYRPLGRRARTELPFRALLAVSVTGLVLFFVLVMDQL
jgi:hypothetical protein